VVEEDQSKVRSRIVNREFIALDGDEESIDVERGGI
jgi:hypothetical protein